jgi:DNA-binding transcriptional LysR family regulator
MTRTDNRIRHVTLRQLQIFLAAARHLNFARAAQELHLTQPAVWMQVKQLEELVGLPLFDNVARKLHLTEAGAEVRRLAAAMLAEIRRSEARIRLLAGAEGGRIALGVVSTGQYVLPRLLALLRRSHPDLQVHLTVGNRDQLMPMLARNELDLCVMGRPPAEAAIVAETFAPHPQVVIAAPSHPLAGLRDISPQQLAEQVLLLREPGSGSRAVAEEFFATYRAQPRQTITISGCEAVKQAVIADLGVALIGLHALALELHGGDLVLLDVRHTPIERRWHLVRLADKKLSPASQALWGFLASEAPAWLDRRFAEALAGLSARRAV